MTLPTSKLAVWMAGPGCGVEDHPTACLCDVQLPPPRKVKKARRITRAKAEIAELMSMLES